MEVEDDRPVGGEQGVELGVGQAVGVFGRRLEAHQVDHVDDADPQARQGVRAGAAAAARVSSVGTSPAQASTTSGSWPASVEAQSMMPRPRVQWVIASSGPNRSRTGCFPATMTLT